jgi:hypothetical protein
MSVYADHVIIFLRAPRSNAAAVRLLLDIFGEASGLICNMWKSSVSSICCGDDMVEEISLLLNCQVAKLPITYLGLPLHFKKARKEDIQALIDKIRNRFAAWKTYMLIEGG